MLFDRFDARFVVIDDLDARLRTFSRFLYDLNPRLPWLGRALDDLDPDP
jgi:hypothetical protein